jgi:hypothetical protein
MNSSPLKITMSLLRLLWLSACCFAFTISATAQTRVGRQLIVPLADGGFVAFQTETAFAATTKASNITQAQGAFDSQALIDDQQIIHRLIADAEGRPVFGYDLVVRFNSTLKQFSVEARPLDGKIEKQLLARSGSQAMALNIPTLPQASDSQVLDDGDGFSLDLLINAETGMKIVDVVKVSLDRANLWNVNPRSLPRDFTLDAVQLAVKEYQLLLNGEVIGRSKSSTGCSGALIWFYVPDHGRFIFSLVPREGYQFQKVGTVANNKIEFTIGSDHYEWISSAPVLSDAGAWNLWVLHDPKYTPLMVAEPQQEKKDAWDKLDDAVKAVKADTAKLGNKTRTYQEQEKQTAKAKQRVMAGSADKIENLWPK